ncbi:Hypothetical protein POVR1_LOCUS305 [uncultured virus]|nr:Hypothetical protein POVR1_LOCUS305 [uncultured virus]
MSDIITVGDLKRALADLNDSLPLIYSHDDEGNEYQRVINTPSIVWVKKQKSYRFLERVDDPDDDEDFIKSPDKYEECVIIN